MVSRAERSPWRTGGGQSTAGSLRRWRAWCPGSVLTMAGKPAGRGQLAFERSTSYTARFYFLIPSVAVLVAASFFPAASRRSPLCFWCSMALIIVALLMATKSRDRGAGFWRPAFGS